MLSTAFKAYRSQTLMTLLVFPFLVSGFRTLLLLRLVMPKLVLQLLQNEVLCPFRLAEFRKQFTDVTLECINDSLVLFAIDELR